MQRIIKAAIAALWFMLLTLPVLGIKLNTAAKTVVWRFDRIFALGAGIFVLALIWDWCFSRKAADPRHASYYYSRPQLRVSGQLSLNGVARPVTGLAWLDAGSLSAGPDSVRELATIQRRWRAVLAADVLSRPDRPGGS